MPHVARAEHRYRLDVVEFHITPIVRPRCFQGFDTDGSVFCPAFDGAPVAIGSRAGYGLIHARFTAFDSSGSTVGLQSSLAASPLAAPPALPL
jgi:hypothetical protein